MVPTELSQIERKIQVNAPRELVWKAITNIEEFSKWFSVQAIGVFEPGARVKMTSTYKGHEGAKFEVIVDRMEPPRLFSWRWHPGAEKPAGDRSAEPTTTVEFHLHEVEGGTEVTVIESGFDRLSLEKRARILAQNEKGWEIQMASLEQYLRADA